MAKEELTYIIERDVEHPLTEQELDDIARLIVQIYLKSHENENTRTA
jgi:DNA-binding cell septation regulator SpoVG